MSDKRRQAPTRQSLTNVDSDSTGFVLAEDSPPAFVETSTRYQVLSELGRGGGGIVYKARDTRLNRMVAVKVLRREYQDRSEIVHRFEQEARIICHLQHPGVAPVFECGSCPDGRPFHAMKLVQGQTMIRMIAGDHDGGDKQTPAINAFSLICQTIAYTHSRDIVHLDLKPGNFMIGVFGEVHVMDWGTARFLDVNGQYESVGMAQPQRDRSRMVGGTLEYMSPEQARGGLLDKRTDVFALGACLCHILTGDPPYIGKTRHDVLETASNAELRTVHNDLQRCHNDSRLIRLAINCLQKNPSNRPRDGAEVAREMSSYQEAALGQFQSDMSRFFELSHDLFCIAGMDGYFRRINSNFPRLLGYSEEELMSRPFTEFVHPDDHDKTLAAMAQLIDGKPVLRFQNRYRKACGNFLHVEWTAKSIPEEGLIFAVARDVSDIFES